MLFILIVIFLSQELLQAREQINALSISLRDSQATKTEAQVTALMKRNEKLASSVFGAELPDGGGGATSRLGSRAHRKDPSHRTPLEQGRMGHRYQRLRRKPKPLEYASGEGDTQISYQR
ncbi:hypothetical protein RB195_003234 [Necator americanus]|uniref:Uncharacterized protein n=1 Tax=Necator americanus TaxID=51031 RepID=A0ABR1DMP5_NECAM